MYRVWFNHWFSTAYNIIQLIKEEDSKFVIVGSNQQINSVIKNVCDEWYEEPALDGEEYIEYCLEFCKSAKIDIFVPRRKMVEISQNIERFEALNVKVMVDKYELISILNRKDLAYELFCDSKNIRVPEYIVAKNLPQFELAYQSLKEKYDRVCMKFVQDEGGMSFRVIDDSISKFASLSKYPSAKVSYTTVIEALREEETFRDIMVMPYLPGNEISVDCLYTKQGLIAIPRVKGPSRDELVEFDDTFLSMCREILHKVPLEYPCNIQFKYLDQVPYLLEVNTRMSGGLQMGCLATGVNLPSIALHKLLGIDKEWSLDRTSKTVSYVEIPQIIVK